MQMIILEYFKPDFRRPQTEQAVGILRHYDKGPIHLTFPDSPEQTDPKVTPTFRTRLRTYSKYVTTTEIIQKICSHVCVGRVVAAA